LLIALIGEESAYVIIPAKTLFLKQFPTKVCVRATDGTK
jgi:hypothetical protein